jgi:hypothetical protein
MQRPGGQRVQVHINSPPIFNDQGAKVIDAVGVIGMGVGEEYAVEPIHLGIEELLAQVGRGINQRSREAGPMAALDQERCPAASVPGIVGITITPTEGGTRHPA